MPSVSSPPPTPPRSKWRDQLRVLARVFLARFFENEITSGAHELRASFFYLIAFLAVPGAVAPIFLGFSSFSPDPSTWGWGMIAQYQGVGVLRTISRADKTFYLGFAMISAGIVSAVVWNSLLLDRRDGLILGTLPVKPGRVVGAKIVALAGYVAMLAVGVHALASVSFGAGLASNNTLGFALRGIAAHFIASFAASAFVCLGVAGIQGVLLAALGPRLGARRTPSVRAGNRGRCVRRLEFAELGLADDWRAPRSAGGPAGNAALRDAFSSRGFARGGRLAIRPWRRLDVRDQHALETSRSRRDGARDGPARRRAGGPPLRAVLLALVGRADRGRAHGLDAGRWRPARSDSALSRRCRPVHRALESERRQAANALASLPHRLPNPRARIAGSRSRSAQAAGCFGGIDRRDRHARVARAISRSQHSADQNWRLCRAAHLCAAIGQTGRGAIAHRRLDRVCFVRALRAARVGTEADSRTSRSPLASGANSPRASTPAG